MRKGSSCEGRGGLPGLASHTPAPPQLRPRGPPTPLTPTGSCAVYHYPDDGHMERQRQLKKTNIWRFFLKFQV